MIIMKGSRCFLMTLKLSILDQSPISRGGDAAQALEASVQLAKIADESGYTRFWCAEHHGLPGLACAAPELLISRIGAQTRRIRVGSGAVLLPFYSPYKIAEQFQVLAAMYPERIDLGIGRAPGASAEITLALRDNYLERVRSYPRLVKELYSYLNTPDPKASHSSLLHAETPPQLWLLGTGHKSAELAARIGANYAFGHFMSEENGSRIIEKYKTNFRSAQHAKPSIVIAVTVICAASIERAHKLAQEAKAWRNELHAAGPLPAAAAASNDENRPQPLIGTPREVMEQLLLLQQQYQADEFMIVTNTADPASRFESYRLLAAECLS